MYCHVSPDQLGGARNGDWVIARILKYPEDGGAGTARVVKLLDPEKPVTLATEAAIAKYDLPHEFTAAAQREAESHGREVDATEAAQRTDLRSLPLVTIDGEDAKDFDDAVYAEETPSGWRLIVAIADVSHYVREGGELDAEARARGTSVYFPTRVVPMLPHVLSDKLCSLEPHVDRLCLVADMQISKRGELKGSIFYPAVMRSACRLTYNLAHRGAVRRTAGSAAAAGAAGGPAAAAGGRLPRAAAGAAPPRRARLRRARSATSPSTKPSTCARSASIRATRRTS